MVYVHLRKMNMESAFVCATKNLKNKIHSQKQIYIEIYFIGLKYLVRNYHFIWKQSNRYNH